LNFSSGGGRSWASPTFLRYSSPAMPHRCRLRSIWGKSRRERREREGEESEVGGEKSD
jgi:hypothetical protein